MQALIYIPFVCFTSIGAGLMHGFVDGIALFCGTLIIWTCAFQALACLFYGDNIKKKISIALVQFSLVALGFYIISYSDYTNTFFGIQLDYISLGCIALGMGILLAITKRPPQDEIDSFRK